MKHLAMIQKNIKGRNWQFKLLSDRIFDKVHNPEGTENNTAMTVSSKYEVHFSKSEWNLVDIRHELLHVYFHMSNTVAADLTPLQTEETIADIFGHNGPEMCMVADSVAECFFNYLKE